MSGKNDDLDENLRDRLVAVLRGGAGAIPYGGGIVGELLSAIPGQRTDRIVIFVRQLNDRLTSIEEGRYREILDRPDKMDFIEEGGRQAARAISPERIPKIVEAVARGLTSEESDVIRRKRLLVLLGELDDDELFLLGVYGQTYGGDPSAWNTVNRPRPPHLESTIDEVDQDKLFEAGREHLLRLGLIEKRYRVPHGAVAPTFDPQKGDFKHSLEISYLGRMLLREIGLPAPIDKEAEQSRT